MSGRRPDIWWRGYWGTSSCRSESSYRRTCEVIDHPHVLVIDEETVIKGRPLDASGQALPEIHVVLAPSKDGPNRSAYLWVDALMDGRKVPRRILLPRRKWPA